MPTARPPFTQRLAVASATHPYRVLVGWLVICVVMGALATTSLSDHLTSAFTLGGDYQSVRAKTVLEEAGLPPVSTTRETILVDAGDQLTADDPAFTTREATIADNIRDALSHVLTEANGKPVSVAALTLEDLESGELPAPSVIDRQTIQRLVDQARSDREAAFRSRGDALAVRGDALLAQEEALKQAQESIQSQVQQGLLSPQDAAAQGAELAAQGQTLAQAATDLNTDREALDADIAQATHDADAQLAKVDTVIDSLTGKDNHSSIILVNAGQPINTINIEDWTERIQAQRDGQLTVTTLGQRSIQHAFSHIVEEDLSNAELTGVPITLLVLVVVFGALIAALNSLLLAVVAITCALGLAAVVGQVMTLQLFVTNMISMLGLAVGIDYCLFVTERYREERRRGRPTKDAIAIAGGTSGMAMTFSGATVILSLLGIMFVPLNVYQSMSLGAVLVVSMAVAAVLTLLPAILVLLGDRINWPVRTRSKSLEAIDERWLYSGFFGQLTKLSVTHPWAVMTASVAFLVALAIPALSLQTGFVGADSLPRGDVADGVHRLYDQWGEGQLFPVELVATTPERQRDLTMLEQTLVDDPLVETVLPIETSKNGKVSRLDLHLKTSPSDPKSYDWVRNFRAEHAPEGDDQGLLVGGQSAGELDMQLMLAPTTPLAIGFVLTLSFILLMIAFRSLIVPIKAMIYNLLSVGATYGVMTLVFAHGWGLDLLGYTHTPKIEAWLPILLFSVLFGLSMDYHVFILSRMREHYDRTGNNRESVAMGIRSTSRIITGAALIMVVVFMTFSFGSATQIQQLGFGLAVAVFLDATVIRSLLVPSVMVLMDHLNWWLPGWLRWLPKINIEGPPAEDILDPPTQETTTKV
ncbi:MMPL family transporter [Stomatohabitans albus]|uniref:MMPL family transporter n=1 Tax=Stomatohabitans albus TaxID=3110766 RepID=UPI00300D29BF